MTWINAQKKKPFLDGEMAKEIISITELLLQIMRKEKIYFTKT